MYHFKRIFLVQLVNMQNSPLFYDAKTYALHNYWMMSNKKLEETDWQVALPKERSQFKAFNCSFSSTSYVAWHLSCIAFKWDMTMASAPNRLWKISSSNTWNSSFISCDVNTLFWYLIAVQFFPSLFFFCKFERRDPVKVWWIQVLSRIY